MSNSVKNTFLTLTLISAFSASANAQVLNEVKNDFTAYHQNILQEKIFVHTDKSAYLTGEIIWFKIYNLNAADNKPVNLSKVAYVDLLDTHQNAVIQAKIALKNGIGTGSLYVPVSVNNGNYKFRAYTNWMKNSGPDYYFEKTISILNPLKFPETLAKKSQPDDDIQFFPEGGNLVSGMSSRVAFRAVGADAKGIVFNGAIIDEHHDTVVRFKPLKFGMGSFMFTPGGSHAYKAVIRLSDNKSVVKDLPAIHQQGYVMQVNDAGAGQLKLTVTCNTADNELYLFAHSSQVVNVVKSGAVNNGVTTFLIDKSSLAEGITNLTIFNQNKQPVCERLYFIRPKPRLLLTASPDLQQYGSRKKININITAKDASGKFTATDLSLSVYRVDEFQPVDPTEIAGYLWLKSELKGNIESLQYYLQNNDAEANEALDNLVLSQGWRRFKWDNVLHHKLPAFSFLPEYEGHLITGKVMNTLLNKPADNVVSYLGVPGKRVQLYAAKSDSSGTLLFNTKDLYGAGEIVVQTNPLKDSTYRIDINSPFSEQYSKTPIPEFNVNRNMQRAIEAESLGMQVQNLYAGVKTKQFINPVTDSSAFYGLPYKSYKLDDYTRFTTMEEVLREYVSAINVVRSQNRFHIKVLNDRGFLDNDPLVILDGVPVFNTDKVFSIDPLKIRRLEVVRDRYFYGPTEFEGILSYTTYKGDLGGYEFDPHAVVLDYEGMQLQREFYSPVYDTEQQAASRLPDFRNLLYWSPSVQTDGLGKGRVSFYSSDQTGTYYGLIQGITANGAASSATFKFEVKK